MTTPPRTRTSDPWTSHAAETTLNMPRSHRLVLAAFRDLGPSSAEHVENHLRGKVSPSRARSAISELADLGHVEVVGETKTSLGRSCRVHALTLTGLAETS